jgi:hypothetical protein
LLQTIFYFEHATRELVLDSVLALAVAGAVRYFYPPPWAGRDPAIVRLRRRFALWTVAVLVVILGGTVYGDAFTSDYAASARGQAILDNLAQYPTRPGAPLAWGAHWRYHLIERFAEIALAFCVAGLLWLRDGRPEVRDAPRRLSLYTAAVALFVLATLVFRPSTEPFLNPMFLGHQLRELLTHTLVTLPLALGTCFMAARKFSAPASRAGSRQGVLPIYVAGGVSLACEAFLLVASIVHKAQTYGQKTGLAELLFPHFFEHSLGYVFVSALAGLLYLWPLRAPGAAATKGAAPAQND